MPVPQFLLGNSPSGCCSTWCQLGVHAGRRGVNLERERETLRRSGRVAGVDYRLGSTSTLSWIAAQGIHGPFGSGSVGTSAGSPALQTGALRPVRRRRKFVPILAAYFGLKATLSRAAGGALLRSCCTLTVALFTCPRRCSSYGANSRRSVCDDRHAFVTGTTLSGEIMRAAGLVRPVPASTSYSTDHGRIVFAAYQSLFLM